MSTHNDTQRSSSADPVDRPPVTRRFTTAALVAAAAVVVAIVWAAVVIIPLTDEVGAFPRTDVPGETTVTIDEADGQVVYYERQTWFAATPMNPQLEVEVTDADNQAVSTSAYEPPLQYRMPGLVGEAAATFDPPRAGAYTVAVDTTDAADPLPDDARVAVGPSVAGRVAGGLIAPIVLLIGGLIVAAVIAIRAAAGRPRHEP